jgi:hypothetical protein
VRFSQRKGLTPVRETMQRDGIDPALRNALWNAYTSAILRRITYSTYEEYLKTSNLWRLFTRYWHGFFHETLDTLDPYRVNDAQTTVRKFFMKCEWFEIYDFIEFTAQEAPKDLVPRFSELINEVLTEHMSAYRLVSEEIVEITDEQEIQSIEKAINEASPIAGVRAHLEAALKHLGDRKNPDFRNSIKESISAVEALAKVITGEKNVTLGQAVKKFENKTPLHPALKDAFSSLYGWTSDAQGIRHAMLDETNLTFNDAKFMLVACTGFINFLLGKAADEGIKLTPPK